jgi:C4-dicarboxylate-specific signal transduction histidine kinase
MKIPAKYLTWNIPRSFASLAAIVGAYLPLQYLLLAVTHDKSSLSLSAAPSILIAWHFGIAVALGAGAFMTAAIAVFKAIILGFPAPMGFALDGALSLMIFSAVAVFVGGMSELSRELHVQLSARQQAEKQLRETTAQLIQTEKFLATGELAAGVAHELNQPLNCIKIIAQSLLRDIELARVDMSAVPGEVGEVVLQVDRMAAIIDHMRIFTRRSTETVVARIDVNRIIAAALMFVEHQCSNHDIHLACKLHPAPLFIQGDAVRLEQVVLNLLSNARGAVEVINGKTKRVVLRTGRTAAGNPVIEIADNGTGIPDHVMPKLFQPFFTTKEPGKGTGLGLSVSKKIIEEHRGTIEIESRLNEGTTVRVVLPAGDAEAARN